MQTKIILYASTVAAVSVAVSVAVRFSIYYYNRHKMMQVKEEKKKIQSTTTNEIGKCYSSIESSLTYNIDRLLTLRKRFLSVMKDGLIHDNGEMLMIPSFVTTRPHGGETGISWAIDLGGTNLRVMKSILKGNGVVVTELDKKIKITVEAMTGDAPELLFDLIASLLKECGAGNGQVVGFTFSFPVNQISLGDGTLTRWTKGFCTTGVVGENVTELLSQACVRVGVDVNIIALVNDTVGTLAACAYEEPACMIGLILGTGSNASYCESMANIPKLEKNDGDMLINMEWGAFRSGLDLTKMDTLIDAASLNKGGQLFEKQISGMYLGEISRLAIVDLFRAGEIFKDVAEKDIAEFLSTPMILQTAHMSCIVAELYSIDATNATATATTAAAAPASTTATVHTTTPTTPTSTSITSTTTDTTTTATTPTTSYPRTMNCFSSSLKMKNINGIITDEDCYVFAQICKLVAVRAASLAAVGISAIILQLGDRGKNCVVGVDGSLFEKFPRFQDTMEQVLSELETECILKLTHDGSGIGSSVIAMTAAVAASKSNPTNK